MKPFAGPFGPGRRGRVLDLALHRQQAAGGDAREVREGFECGLNIKNFNDVKIGDVLECYRVEEVARTLAGIAAEQERAASDRRGGHGLGRGAGGRG